MSIRYGRPLPKGPRPKPPQPKLGEVGALRGVTRAQRRRQKAKQADITQSASNQGSQSKDKDSQQQSKPRKKKKAKREPSRQNTPVKVEIVKPIKPASTIGPDGSRRSTRVVVEWWKDGRRYLAWGRLGAMKVEGWRECSTETIYRQFIRKLSPIGTKLSVTDSQIPVVEILDLMIAAGKVLKPRRKFTSGISAAQKSPQTRPTRRHSRVGSRPNRDSRSRRSAAAEAARHEALVVRPSDGKPSTAARRRQSSGQTANAAQKRKQMLARQRRELRRLSWLRRHGYEARQAPRDMMDVALQGGSPGLKR